ALALPADVNVRNPVDVGVGFKSPLTYHDRMRACVRELAADPEIDVVAVMASFGPNQHSREMLSAGAAEAGTLGKPVMVFQTRTSEISEETLTEVRDAGLPALSGARETLRAIGHFRQHSQHVEKRGALRQS